MDSLCQFEDIMIEVGIKREKWPKHLHSLIMGRALVAYANNILA